MKEDKGKLTKEVIFGLAIPGILVGVMLVLVLKTLKIKHN